MDKEASFVHEPLDQVLSQIRLVSVIPEADGPVRCLIRHINLDANPTLDYRAVSYTWGPPLPNHRIYVGDKPLVVRLNLYEFLLAFRKRLHGFQGGEKYEEESQWLWVDQICIDQSSIKERNHQVQMMSSIYRQATYVYVWLGSSDERTEAAMQALKIGFRRYHDERYSATSSGRRHVRSRKESRENADDPRGESVDALQQFFRNPYWQRLWIVQEVMLARYIRIICGDTLLSWEELRRLCVSGLSSLPAAQSVGIPMQTSWLAEHALSAKTYAFDELLHAFKESQCENPRDKVYGLQGLLAPDERVEIDYGKSVEEVYFDAAYIICEGPRILSSEGPDSIYKRIDLCGPVKLMADFACHNLERWLASVRATQAKLVGKPPVEVSEKNISVEDLEPWNLRGAFHDAYGICNDDAYAFCNGHCQRRREYARSFRAQNGNRHQWYGYQKLDFCYANRYREKKHILPFMTRLACSIRSQTRHIENTSWSLDIFFPRKFQFCNVVDEKVSAYSTSFEYSLTRDTSCAQGEFDDTELEIRFQPHMYYIGLSRLQILFRETSYGAASIIVSLSISTNPMWLPLTRYLSCNIDLEALHHVRRYDRGTVVIFNRDDSSLQYAESALKQDNIVHANTFCDIGDERLQDVWTGRSKLRTSAGESLKNEIMFWRSTAVGYRR